MFEDKPRSTLLAEALLDVYDLEDIFEMNNLSEHEVLETLIDAGQILYPERILPE